MLGRLDIVGMWDGMGGMSWEGERERVSWHPGSSFGLALCRPRDGVEKHVSFQVCGFGLLLELAGGTSPVFAWVIHTVIEGKEGV